jgi:hypothetical protein
MHTNSLTPTACAPEQAATSASLPARARAYFASDTRRALQTALGLLWLSDGALQFQPFMYSRGFVQTLTRNAAGQPHWLATSIRWAGQLLQHNLTAGNTLFALAQLLIGVGLLHRRTVRPALSLSFAWALGVWWFGEAFGMLFTGTASPLTGAPGAVLLYALIGLLVWPTPRPGGLLGVRGARATWAALWMLMAWLWLLAANSGADATQAAITAAPSGIGWLSGVQHDVAAAASGNGLVIASVLAALSAAIGVAGAVNWRPKLFLSLAIILSLAYWVIGQGLGGVFTGAATDPNAGPLFVLLAFGLYSLTPVQPRVRSRASTAVLAEPALPLPSTCGSAS